ncbi:MAG TPA: hypothetical protein PLQ41_03805 [bacterium]|nr:hypothetical protein [bacterium]HPP30214.1 hypothetical protein [bacterium]
MIGYKKILMIFIILPVIYLRAMDGNKDRVLDNFFTKIRSAQPETFPAIESIQANIKTEITFSQETLAVIQPFINNISKESMSNVLTGTGDIKIKFTNIDGKNKAEYIYLYFNNPLLNFVFTKSGDDIEIVLPKMGIIIKDNINEIEKIMNQYKQQIDKQKSTFPSNIAKETINYIIANENIIREKIKMKEKTGEKDGVKTYIFNYPVNDGNLNIEIFDKYWSFASISFSDKNKSFIRMDYSIPDKKSGYFIYLPETILLQKEEKGNKLSTELSDIKYNLLFSNNDFKILNMNFQEFTAFMYLKLLQR